MKVSYAILLALALIAAPGLSRLGAAFGVAIEGGAAGAPAEDSAGFAAGPALQAGILGAAEDAAELARQAASRAPSAVVTEFEEESRAMARAAGVADATKTERHEEAIRALAAWPAGVGGFLNAAEAPLGSGPTRYGVGLDSLSEVLAEWARISDPAEPHAAVREAMEGNFALLDEALRSRRARVARLTEHAGDLDELVEARKRIDDGLLALQDARAKSALSKDDAFRAVETAFRAMRDRWGDNWLARAGGLFPGRRHADDFEIFPLVSHGNGYWGYEHVVDWAEQGVVPLEMPVHGKSFDGGWGAPHTYTAHDHTHATYMMKDLFAHLQHDYASTLHSREALEDFAPRARALAETAPARGLSVKKAIGLMLWEHTSLAELLEEAAFIPRETVETLATWARDLGERLGDESLLDEADSVLRR